MTNNIQVSNDNTSEEFDAAATSVLGRTKTAVWAKGHEVRMFMRNYDAGIVGNAVGIFSAAFIPGSFSIASLVTGIGVEVVKSGRGALKKETLDLAVTYGALKTVGARTVPLAILGLVGVGFATMTAGCLEAPQPIYAGQNISVDPVRTSFSGNVTLGDDVRIGHYVSVYGENITVDHAALEGHASYATGKSSHSQDIRLQGHDVSVTDSTLRSGNNRTGYMRIQGDRNVIAGSVLDTEPGHDLYVNDQDNSIINTIMHSGRVSGARNLIMSSFMEKANVGSDNHITASNLGHGSFVKNNCSLTNVTLEEGATVDDNSVLSDGVVGVNGYVPAGTHAQNFNVPDRDFLTSVVQSVGGFVGGLLGGPK